jgi:hypothetical protein
MMITPRHNQFDAVAPVSHIKVQAARGRRHACRRYGPAAELGSDFTDTRQLTLALNLHLFSQIISEITLNGRTFHNHLLPFVVPQQTLRDNSRNRDNQYHLSEREGFPKHRPS